MSSLQRAKHCGGEAVAMVSSSPHGGRLNSTTRRASRLDESDPQAVARFMRQIGGGDEEMG
jgi:hypothetical protein